MQLGRRGFIGGIAALVAAPAIVRASSIMPVRSFERTTFGPVVNGMLNVGDVISFPENPIPGTRQFIVTAITGPTIELAPVASADYMEIFSSPNVKLGNLKYR